MASTEESVTRVFSNVYNLHTMKSPTAMSTGNHISIASEGKKDISSALLRCEKQSSMR